MHVVPFGFIALFRKIRPHIYDEMQRKTYVVGRSGHSQFLSLSQIFGTCVRSRTNAALQTPRAAPQKRFLTSWRKSVRFCVNLSRFFASSVGCTSCIVAGEGGREGGRGGGMSTCRWRRRARGEGQKHLHQLVEGGAELGLPLGRARLRLLLQHGAAPLRVEWAGGRKGADHAMRDRARQGKGGGNHLRVEGVVGEDEREQRPRERPLVGAVLEDDHVQQHLPSHTSHARTHALRTREGTHARTHALRTTRQGTRGTRRHAAGCEVVSASLRAREGPHARCARVGRGGGARWSVCRWRVSSPRAAPRRAAARRRGARRAAPSRAPRAPR